MLFMKKACIGLALLSAVLLPLALPNDFYAMGNPLLGLVCLTPLFVALALSPSLGFASLLGMLFAALSTLFAHYWLLFYGDYSFWAISGVILGYVIYHAILAPVLSILLRTRRSVRFLLVAAAWTVYEYVKSSGFLGFPWGLLPHSMATVPIALQCVDIAGIWGLSLIIALVNSWTAELVLSGPHRLVCRRSAAFVGFLLFLSLGYGVYRWNRPYSAEGTVKAILVQHNEDPWSTGRSEEAVLAAQALSLEAISDGFPRSAGGAGDVLVWSETAIELFLNEATIDRAMAGFPAAFPLADFIRSSGMPFLVGAPFRPEGGGGYQNAVLFFSPEAELLDYYGKQHLVPIAETIPFYDFPPFKLFFGSFLGLSAGWERGSRRTVMRLDLAHGRSVSFGTPICFEDAFPDLCRRFVLQGADLLINLTNVAWSRRQSAELQMYVAALFRSIENRRPLLRATNAGVTAAIGPRGEILGSLDLFTAGSLAVEVPINGKRGFTAYTRFGDYLPWLLAGGILLYVLGLIVGMRAKRSGARVDRDVPRSLEDGKDRLL